MTRSRSMSDRGRRPLSTFGGIECLPKLPTSLTQCEVFAWALADRGLLKGKRIAIHSTTEANAAMRSIERWHTNVSYAAFKRVIVKTKGFLALFRHFLQSRKVGPRSDGVPPGSGDPLS